MAQITKRPNEKLLKEKLQSLECPYTVDADDAWVSELLLQPGEQRILLLQWLFSKFDSKLNDVLDPKLASYESRMDSRVQRILFVASSLGFCKYDEVDLIRGVNTKQPRQLAFWEQVIDSVCIIDSAEDPHKDRFVSKQIKTTDEMSLDEQTSQDCAYMDAFLRNDKVAAVFNNRVHLLPPDIQRNVEMSRNLQGDLKDKTLKPDISALKETSERVAKDLQRQQEILQDLMETCPYQKSDETKMEFVCKTLHVVLSELHQLVTSFSYSYENEVSHWCNKRQPDLSSLGPTFKRVHTLLQQFIGLLDGFKSIRSSYSNLTSDADSKTKQILEKNKLQMVAGIQQASAAAMLSFQDCVSVLDESIQRREHDLTNTSSSFHSGISVKSSKRKSHN